MSDARRIEAAVAVARSLALPEILAVRHLCEITGRSAKTVRRWLRQGLLPGRRIGRAWLVPKRALLGAIQDDPGRFRIVPQGEGRP